MRPKAYTNMGWLAARYKNKKAGIETYHKESSKLKISGENLTPNMRALRLAMTAGDVLLGMGIPASRVVSRCLDITETYCKLPVHVDINSNIIILSQIRGVEKEPLTLMRPVVEHGVNSMTIHRVQHLIYQIRTKQLDLGAAEEELDSILKQPVFYPTWLTVAGNAGIAASVTLMFTNSWRVVVVTFIIAIFVDRLLTYLKSKGITSFFRIVAASILVTLSAALIRLLNDSGVSFFSGMNPTLIVVGGIIMLVSGLMIVGAILDAIEEFYVTASARILRVMLQTMGIVIGILIGLYTARKAGVPIAVSPNPLSLNTIQFQMIGGGLAAAAYAISIQTRAKAILWAGAMGAVALFVMHSTRQFDISIVAASGVAAVLVGLLASMFSRHWKTPSTSIIWAGILPLVPGLALYNGLMQLADYPPGDPLFTRGLGTMFMAISTAISIAVGASFGSMIARPLHQRLTYVRNVQPFLSFMRIHTKSGYKRRSAKFVLNRGLEHIKELAQINDKRSKDI